MEHSLLQIYEIQKKNKLKTTRARIFWTLAVLTASSLPLFFKKSFIVDVQRGSKYDKLPWE